MSGEGGEGVGLMLGSLYYTPEGPSTPLSDTSAPQYVHRKHIKSEVCHSWTFRMPNTIVLGFPPIDGKIGKQIDR